MNSGWAGRSTRLTRARPASKTHGGLKGRLLLAYGEQDSNVDPSTSLQVVNALIRAGKDFDMLVFPGVDHGFGRSVELARYFERKKYDFFVESLKLEQRTPDWNGADTL